MTDLIDTLKFGWFWVGKLVHSLTHTGVMVFTRDCVRWWPVSMTAFLDSIGVWIDCLLSMDACVYRVNIVNGLAWCLVTLLCLLLTLSVVLFRLCTNLLMHNLWMLSTHHSPFNQPIHLSIILDLLTSGDECLIVLGLHPTIITRALAWWLSIPIAFLIAD